jgi:hypothetical protein
MSDNLTDRAGDSDSDSERVARIWMRYHGQMERLDFTDPDTRAQLAFDLGILLGLALKGLERRES